MLDFLLGAVIVALAIRGWWRGLLREVIALGIVVFGLVIAFRLSTPVGDAIESLAGVSPEVGRFIAGLLIFLMVSVGGAIAAAILHKGMKVVPGLPTANRLAGSALAVVVVVALATVALSLLTVASPPQAIADEVEGSAIAGYLTDPGQPPQKVLGVVSGDRSLERLLNLADNIGT
ncbi:MAG: CvpA family protein, partial [Acidimicrobiia bacterium]|nr:CvpA family protein [Acidimicrobiia bacterium]